MIEYCSENIWYVKHKNKKKSKRFLNVFIILFIITILLSYYRYIITENIITICNDYAESYSSECVNNAVLISLSDKIAYEDLITIEKDNTGNIMLMTTNSLKANSINRDVAKQTQMLLNSKISKGFDIPWLAFTGISILSGYGKKISFKALSISKVNCTFDSSFKSVGINQTLHSIYIKVLCSINIELPFNNKNIEYITPILLCESVLVGKVPEIYLNGSIK